MFLVICKSKMHADSVSEMLGIMGVLSYSATPVKALSEISLSYRAVLILTPEALPDAKDFCQRLRAYHKSVPVFALSDIENSHGIFDMVFAKNTKASTVLYAITEYQKAHSLPLVGDYRFAGFDAVASNSSITYFGQEIPFTKTESMILRYLMRAYPVPQSSKSILAHAFRPTRSPDEASIRTHISLMNKKFRAIAEKNAITHREGEGYLLLTPEITENLL